MATIRVNGRQRDVSASPDTPLLYVLMNELELKGPRFGCGLAQCGSCSVLIDGVETRSCVTPLRAVGNKAVVTLEGLPESNAATPAARLAHAYEEEQAVQCGYCFNGMMIKATELLTRNGKPSAAQIKKHMNGHLCRCGNYPRIVRAIQRAASGGAA